MKRKKFLVAPSVLVIALLSTGCGAAPRHTTKAGTILDEAEAKGIALAHAGVTESDVRFVRVRLEEDDGRQEYEIEFYRDTTEYDYDIDALTGTILSYDHDAESAPPVPKNPETPPSEPPSSALMDADGAKAAALAHAGFKENEVARLRIELDYDDGRAEYDVEFHVGGIAYTYEIHAVSGKILSYEAEQDD
jgi:uncharacterized membrane protein YkoI